MVVGSNNFISSKDRETAYLPPAFRCGVDVLNRPKNVFFLSTGCLLTFMICVSGLLCCFVCLESDKLPIEEEMQTGEGLEDDDWHEEDEKTSVTESEDKISESEASAKSKPPSSRSSRSSF